MSGRLSHLNDKGEARMVDVSAKDVTSRTAIAEGFVAMAPETLDLILEGKAEKGDVLAIARVAGIMGAKRTHELIPLCHPLPVTQVKLDFTPSPDDVIEQTLGVPKDRVFIDFKELQGNMFGWNGKTF